MKKMRLFLPAMLICAVLTGCGNKEKETEAPTEAPTEAQTQAPTEALTETETQPQTETETRKEDSMSRTRSLKGLVKASDSSTLTIQTERGKELKLSLTGADIQVNGGITVGNNVVVLYKGTIQDTDTSNAKVQMVKDLDAGETPVTEGELMTEAEEADPDAGAGTLEGTIADLNMDRMVILANDGDSFYFAMYGADMNLKNGLQEGNYVTVQYSGDIYGPYLVEATSITDAQEEADKVAYGGSGAEGSSYVGGTITDCTMTTLTMESDNGEELTFTTTGASMVYVNGIQYGNYITVEYTGEITDGDASGAQVISVYDYSENAPAENSDNTSETSADNQESEAGQTAGGSGENEGSNTNTTPETEGQSA